MSDFTMSGNGSPIRRLSSKHVVEYWTKPGELSYDDQILIRVYFDDEAGAREFMQSDPYLTHKAVRHDLDRLPPPPAMRSITSLMSILEAR